MLKRVLLGLFVLGVGALVWSDAIGCRRIAGTQVCYTGGSGGQIAVIETRERAQDTEACTIEDNGGFYGYGGFSTQQVGESVFLISSKMFGTVKDQRSDARCGFGTNEECDFLALICCKREAVALFGGGHQDDDGDDGHGDRNRRCRIGVVEGSQFARIIGGPGQCHSVEDCISHLRHRPSQDEESQLCPATSDFPIFDSATAFAFFGEICVNGDAGNCVDPPFVDPTRIRQFCTGVPRPDGLFVYQCRDI